MASFPLTSNHRHRNFSFAHPRVKYEQLTNKQILKHQFDIDFYLRRERD